MLISLLSLKLASVLARDMLNFDLTKRALNSAGKQVINLSALIYNQASQARQTTNTNQNQNPVESTEYLVYNWLEALFAWVQTVVLWHDPKLSLCAITGLLSSLL